MATLRLHRFGKKVEMGFEIYKCPSEGATIILRNQFASAAIKLRLKLSRMNGINKK